MNKAQARKAAKRIASGVIRQTLAAGQWDEDEDGCILYADDDYDRVREALEELGWRLDEQGKKKDG